MTPQAVEQARATFRERHVSRRYSGARHLAITVTVGLFTAILCALMLENINAFEWLTIPLTFLYANLSEYLGHRGPMHRKIRFLGRIFERHSIEHHSFFTHEAVTYDTSQDYKAVLFPPILLVFFIAFFALPLGAILYFLISPNVCFLFVSTATLYFLNYELLHFAYHMKPETWVGRLPFMSRLRRHHTYHHNRRLMTSYNFNITYPLCDYLFGTVYRDSE